jgi:hypothetical protein
LQVFISYILSALFIFVDKADIFLFPCPIKYFLLFDCPGCGFQRSVIALIGGDFRASFKFYPPTIPFLISAISGISTIILKGNTNAPILKVMYVATGFIIMANYIYKIATHQLY